MLSTFLFLLVGAAFAQDEVRFTLQPNCALPVELGSTCSNETDAVLPSLRYYMDAETLTCLAFKYTGCGGNVNNFPTKDACQRTCIPMDFNMCPANSEPIRRADNSSYCNNNGPLPVECPSGAVCRMGFVTGLCCDSVITDKVNANYKPDCGNGKKAYKSEQFGFQLIHLGKSCEHSFCPEGATCHPGALFAYCCV